MSSRLSWYVCRLWPYWLISAWSHQFCDGTWTACQRVERHEITTWQKSDFCICGTNREIKTSKTEVNTSTCSFSSKYKNIDLQSYELYETSKNSPLKCCMSDILAKNKLQIKYKKNRDAQIWYLDGRHVQRELKKLDWTSVLIHLATQQWEIQVELI